TVDFPRDGKKIFMLHARRLDLTADQRRIVLLVLTDVTAHRALAARLLTTQEEERRRVSSELHDDLNQKLAMLEVDADRLGQQELISPEVRGDVRSLRDRVAEVSNDIRRVAYQLHPSVLDHLGLHVALRSYCAEFSKREGIQVKFSNQKLDEPLPEQL